jgi:Holliday junction resolvase-like predicted endonuclease
MKNNTLLGKSGERIASEILQKNNCHVLKRISASETEKSILSLEIIQIKSRYFAFIEVKTR